MELYRELTESDKNRISVFDLNCISDYFDDQFTFIKGIVKDDEEVVVVGLGRVVNEFKIIVNPKCSNFKIAKAIKALFKEVVEWARISGSNETIVVVDKGGEHYEKFLIKHFGFKKLDGVPLRLEN